MERRIKLKKKFLTLFLAILCTFTSTNFIFAVVHHTSYQPYLLFADPWALQPQRAPWCFDSCMKIVLKDAQQKNLSHPLGEGFNIPNINAIVGALVPEEEIVHRVLLSNHAIGEAGKINNAPAEQYQAFVGHITNFFDYYLGNRTVHGRIAVVDNSRKFNLLNGLLGVALEDEMDDLWQHLDANTRKMIVQDSAQAVLNRIQQDTGIIGNIHNITSQAEYEAALNNIVTEIETNNRMVILVFQNMNNRQESHACVAYATKRDDTPLHNGQEINVFNPWGNLINMTQTDHGPLFNITPTPVAPRSWLLNRYVTFNY